MKNYPKIAKRYALANSYFKHRRADWPDTIVVIDDYLRQHGELPFRYEGDNWPYDAFCERQKRQGVHLSQHLTPDATARWMGRLGVRHFDSSYRIVDACCGTGQLTRGLLADGVSRERIVGVDCDPGMIDIYARLYPQVQSVCCPYRNISFRCENVIANPPFETKLCIDFLDWLVTVQQPGDHAVLLLPYGFIYRERPKSLPETLQQFTVVFHSRMQERFARTNAEAAVVVLQRR